MSVFPNSPILLSLETAIDYHPVTVTPQTLLLEAIATHEFRTPLTSILGSSRLLENYGDNLSESQKSKHFQRIQRAVKEMNYLLEDILMLENAEYQKIYCHRKTIEMVKFCEQILEKLEVMYPGRTVYLQHDYPMMNAELDPIILRHIFLNLLSNALKYSQPDSPVYFQLDLTNESVIFKIQDQGIGIPSEDLENLFNSFYRGKNVGKIPGTGLGLSIVKNFIQLHRGQIEFHSVVNSGTTVTVTLPLEYRRYSSMLRILTIEDEENIRDTIVETLSMEGFEVIQAENGKVGLKLAQKHLPDLILCDVLMPELDGYDVLRQLNQNRQTQGIPFIFLTAKDTSDDFRYGMNLGANDYLMKPFTTQELVMAVKSRLQRYRME